MVVPSGGKKAAVVRGTPGLPMPRDGNPRFPFVKMPINSGPLRARGLVSDRVSWSDTPIFHNTLVVGSSPTSSTTQSPATEKSEFVYSR